MAAKRGALIVFEGCDRSGKSTQSRLLVELLQSKGVHAKKMAFPARQSDIGMVINKYLTCGHNLSDESVHLLFSANRWEFNAEMKKLLEAGVTVVVDRYSYSGVAYSTAKGMDFEWCMAPERGLLRPDTVFYLKSYSNKLADRVGYGLEKYEKEEFQMKVGQVFERIYEQEKSYWHQLNADLAVDDLKKDILKKALAVVNGVKQSPINVMT